MSVDLRVDCSEEEAAPKEKRFSRRSILHKVDLGNFNSSTKVEALVEELQSMVAAKDGGKAIVFSQVAAPSPRSIM